MKMVGEMRIQLISIFVCAFLAPAAFQGNPLFQPAKVCDPAAGEGSWKDDCNWCRCAVDGATLCTKIKCPSGSPVQNPSEVECRGSPRWKIGNVWCTCKNGRASCDSSMTVGSPISSNCDPNGTGRWKKLCNWCHCNKLGLSLCTRRLCSSESEFREQLLGECEGNPRWKEGDEWCSCVRGRPSCGGSSSGTVTQERPSEFQSSNLGSFIQERPFGSQIPKPVLPRQTCDSTAGEGGWKEDCNWCRCSPRGGSLCTKRGCPPVSPNRDVTDVECEGNPRWKIGEQWCSCVGGRSSCGPDSTSQQLSPQQPPPKEVSSLSETFEVTCQFTGPDDGWRNSCNWCRCTLKGFSICTLRGCDPGIDASQTSEPECRGNAKWKRDCNWCTCFQGKSICTLATCF